MPERAHAMGHDNDVLVIGAGQAGYQVAASLREKGFAGRIRLIGDEPGLPYQRPPLSKAYLLGKSDRTALDLRSEGFFKQFSIEIAAEQRAVRIDREHKQVFLASGEVLSYDHLVLATGSRNRTLPIPGADLDGVMQLRSAQDSDALRHRLHWASRSRFSKPPRGRCHARFQSRCRISSKPRTRTAACALASTRPSPASMAGTAAPHR